VNVIDANVGLVFVHGKRKDTGELNLEIKNSPCTDNLILNVIKIFD
jgi:hypothetical protein